jgi:uncharacterized protein YigA (DUF484 family)
MTQPTPPASETPSRETSPASEVAEATRALVIDYLEANPRFLLDHPELFETLALPGDRDGGKVLDFQTHAIDHLRSNVRRMKDRFNGLLVSARDNMSVQQQVHQAVLCILRARTLEELLEALTTDMLAWFNVDVVRLAMESDMAGLYDTYYREENYSGICFIPSGTVDAALPRGAEVRLTPDTQNEPPIGFEMIFADCSSLVRSAALVRLELETVGRPAVLAFGVRHSGRFHPNQSGELLGFLGSAMSIVLDRCLSQSDVLGDALDDVGSLV